jgi:hypothetical protein
VARQQVLKAGHLDRPAVVRISDLAQQTEECVAETLPHNPEQPDALMYGALSEVRVTSELDSVGHLDY